MTGHHLANLLRPLVERTDGLELLLLVGSRARGEEHAGSDYDLAYLASDNFDPLQFMGQVVLALGTEQVDLADLSRANGLFRYEAARDGIRLFGDPEQHMAFRIQALRFWYDAGPIIDAAYEQTLAGLGPRTISLAVQDGQGPID